MNALISHKPARLRYEDGTYRVLEPGGFVICAATGVTIPLDALKYWSVDLQEAYCDAAAAVSRMGRGGRGATEPSADA